MANRNNEIGLLYVLEADTDRGVNSKCGVTREKPEKFRASFLNGRYARMPYHDQHKVHFLVSVSRNLKVIEDAVHDAITDRIPGQPKNAEWRAVPPAETIRVLLEQLAIHCPDFTEVKV